MSDAKSTALRAMDADPIALAAPRKGLGRLYSGTGGELIRYFIASAIALGVDAGTLLFATEVLGLHYLISATLGFSLGIAVIYTICIRWVFGHRSLADRNAERLIFLIVGLIGLALTDAVIFALTDIAGLHYGISKIGAAAVVFSFNFGARKLALFRAPGVKSTEPGE